MPMTPWWVVTTLGPAGDEGGRDGAGLDGAAIISLLDHQLLQWSRSGGLVSGEASPRWWHAEPFEAAAPEDADTLSARLNLFVRNPLLGDAARPASISGQIDNTRLSVAVVGDVRSPRTRNYLHALGRTVRLAADTKFSGKDLNAVAVIYLPQNAHELAERDEILRFLSELHTMMHLPKAERPFSSVIFLQDTNSTIDNRFGYVTLDTAEAQELAAQVLFHLMVGGGDYLDEERERHSTAYFAIGSAAIYYDWRGHRRRLGCVACAALLSRLREADAAPFMDEGQAELAAAELKRRVTASQLFREFTRKEAAGVAKLPSFSFDSRIWKAATDSRGRTVSPWALFNSRLLLFYFFIHLRYLPLRLSEYSRLFLLTRLQQWGDYLAERREELWNGTGATKGLGEQIHEMFVGVFSGEYGAARSLAQAGRVLDKVREACEMRDLGSILSQLEDYGRLEVFSVPEELREFYEDAPEVLEAKREQDLYDGLVERIKRHPLPLALFGRAALISVMFALLGERLLDFLSPNVVNLEQLLSWPPVTLIVLGAVPFGVAFWRYAVRTLREVRKSVNMYVAGVLRHAQTKAKDAVELEMSRLCDQARGYCLELEGHLGRLRDGLAAPAAEEYTYRTTTFHRPLTGDLAIPGRGRSVSILSNGGMECRISVSGELLLFEECDEEMLSVMLNRFLDARDEPGQRAAWELIAPPPPRAGEDATADDGVLGIFCRSALDYAERLYEDEQQIRLDRWLLLDDQRHCADTLDRLRRLASPPLTFHSGAGKPTPTRSEWKYYDPARLGSLIGDTDDALRPSGDGSVLSFASYQPFGIIGSAPYVGLEDLATVRALGADPEAAAANRAADTPARRFTAATTRLPSSPDLNIISAVDGQVFRVATAAAEIEALRARLKLSAEEEAGPEL